MLHYILLIASIIGLCYGSYYLPGVTPNAFDDGESVIK